MDHVTTFLYKTKGKAVNAHLYANAYDSQKKKKKKRGNPLLNARGIVA
jgi:hypothetical protein